MVWDDQRFLVSEDKTSLAISDVSKLDGEGLDAFSL